MAPGIRILLVSGLLLLPTRSTLLAQDTIDVPSSTQQQHILVDLPLAPTYDPAFEYILVEADHPDNRLSAQLIRAVRDDGLVDDSACQLLASIPPAPGRDAMRTFHIEQGARRVSAKDGHAPPASHFAWQETPLSLKLLETDSSSNAVRQIWEYNYQPIIEQSLPEIDPRRSRSCYIHPLWGMSGETLTDDFPPDHYHHHGIFWTWPYVKVGDKTFDLWMSTDIQQQFVKWLARDTGPVAGIMGVENGWFVGQQQIATERVWLRTYRSEPDCRAVDISLVIEAGGQEVTLQGREDKSYGGFTCRFDVSPRTDATVRVPERTLGFGAANPSAEPDLVNERLPWADLTSQFPAAPQRSGAAVFVHPQHPDYPPTWLTRTYGALCVGWPGVKTITIAPGKSIKLDYRIWVHAQELASDAIDLQYRAYGESLEARCR